MSAQSIAVLDSVSKLYGRFAALRKFTFTFDRGACYVLLGENGAGKSTLLRVLAGLLTPTAGSVLVLGKEPRQARANIGYMSHAPMLYDELTAAENLAYFAGLYPDRATLSPEAALCAVGLDPRLERTVAQYSQGMRQRTSLARVLLSQPALLLLDEPFSNMDAASAAHMLSLIGRMRDDGRTVVLTTHQRELAAPIADCLLSMQAGALVTATNVTATTVTATGTSAGVRSVEVLPA